MTFRKFPYYCVLFIVTLSTLFLSCNNLLLEKKNADFSVQITMPPAYSTTAGSDPLTGGDISTEAPAEKWNLIAWIEEEGNPEHLSPQTISAMSGEIKKINFEKIDVNLKVRVCMTLESSEGKEIYKGESKWFVTQPGTNNISLELVNAEGQYIVLHYFEDKNGEYQLIEVQEKTGPVGELTDEKGLIADGYELDEIDLAGFKLQEPITQVVITPDNTAVIRIYYKREETALPEETFKIKYELKGGNLDETEINKTFKKDEQIDLPTPEKDFYEFSGWYTNGACTTEVELNEEGKYTVSEKITLYANWTPIVYSITYELNVEKDETIQNNNPARYTIETETIELQPLTRDGYDFLGWYDKDEKEVKEILSGTTGDITLTAKWEKATETGKGSVSVNVIIPTYSDVEGINFEFNQSEQVYSITIPAEYAFEGLYVDGNSITLKDNNSYSLEELGIEKGGIYTVMVVVTGSDGNMYSAEYQLKLNK